MSEKSLLKIQNCVTLSLHLMLLRLGSCLWHGSPQLSHLLPAVTPLLMVDGGYNFTWMWLPLQTGPFPSTKREFIGLRIFLRSGFYIHLVWLPWVCWKQCYNYSTWNCVNGYCSSPFHVHHWHDFQVIHLPFLGLRNEESLSAIDLGGTSCRCVDVW